jgi:hypothetical protein
LGIGFNIDRFGHLLGATMNKRMYALGRLKQGKMNRTEESYGDLLESRKQAGQVLWYRFEGLKFRLADATFYTPDFSVMLSDGTLEAHEVKGFWTDDARVKIKVASEMYPIRFIAIRKIKGAWVTESFGEIEQI